MSSFKSSGNIQRKEGLWEDILFSRCPTDCVSVTFCFLNNSKFKNH